MMSPEKVAVLTTLALHAASGLSLGMSVVVLADVLPWRWPDRHPWLVALMLIMLWLPFALSGVPDIRRSGATAVSLYLAGLFVAYSHHVRNLQIAAARSAATTEATCIVRLHGNCVPAPRIPVDDVIGRD